MAKIIGLMIKFNIKIWKCLLETDKSKRYHDLFQWPEYAASRIKTKIKMAFKVITKADKKVMIKGWNSFY